MEVIPMNNKANSTHPLLHVLSVRDFFLLWSGSTISMLGSQFTMIALPWLVLQLTGDPLALGLVLALGGIPRLVFMLVGGAVSDRFLPRTILIACDWANFALAGLTAALIFADAMQLWMLYLLSLLTGLLSSLVIPAANSIAPLIVPEDDLQAGNSILMGSSQLANFVGPALAGIVIGIYAQSSLGIAIAFSIDAASFAICAFALWAMHGGRKLQTPATAASSIWESIGAGIRYLTGHAALRFLFIVMAVVNFLFTGPLLVGIPVLADQRLPEGARAFGFLMSAFAGGNLAGLLLAGVVSKPIGRTLSAILIGQIVAFGLVLISLGWITSTWTDVTLMLLLGIGSGYINIVVFTWIQQRTPKDMLGRMMSMTVLASMGLAPLSQALAGAISRWNLTLLFALAGGLLLLTTLWAALQPALKSLSHEIVTSAVE